MQPALDAYRRAAEAVVAATRDFAPDDWARPSACDGWTNLHVAGHVLAVVRWHHDWLDASLAGVTEPIWPARELPARNADALAALDIASGPDRIVAFSQAARRYAQRIASAWDAPYVYPGGRVTVGVHAQLVVGEWHLHAWDIDRSHRPPADDSELVRTTWIGLARPIDGAGDPWTALLASSGRRSA